MLKKPNYSHPYKKENIAYQDKSKFVNDSENQKGHRGSQSSVNPTTPATQVALLTCVAKSNYFKFIINTIPKKYTAETIAQDMSLQI